MEDFNVFKFHFNTFFNDYHYNSGVSDSYTPGYGEEYDCMARPLSTDASPVKRSADEGLRVGDTEGE